MTYSLTRRGFVTASAALAATAALPLTGLSQGTKLSLTATSRVLDIDGRAASVFGLQNHLGQQGLMLDPGQRFQLDLTNDLDVETIIHWHGQIPPNDQDGVPHVGIPMLQPGEVRSYDYATIPGTHWMHSHVPVQEMALLAAPLIVRRPEDLTADRQEVTMFLHDFSFRDPSEVLTEIIGGAGHDMSTMGGMDMSGGGTMEGMDHSSMDMGGDTMGGIDMGGMDLNDFDFDAYLANDRTLSDPDVIAVERGGRIRLRIVNAAAATSFWIDTGPLPARLVAVDGHEVEPVTGNRFGMAMAQRIDIEVDLPQSGAFPILALREGARERTGIILAMPGATIERMSSLSDDNAPAFDIALTQEQLLRAATAQANMLLPVRAVDHAQTVMLGGAMSPYRWTIDGQTWESHVPIEARSGERVELTFHNMSMMGHPMHLHGHVFQVVNLNGRPIKGALRDTAYVPPMAMVTIAFDAGEVGRWMLHCHHMPHLSTGMMTELVVSA
ncbi:MAG: multicopper oxidase domain-containing protein [Paracoccaceae bacterium]|nr:multicopper oxidase domain-containing protein [Paracoccaceae bacterium]